ncbi:MAG: hypothetical protein U9N14_06320, partial [Pseudomonadota bacterium]|nr:hypothetical protein [Pseudomonadota bacterium]
LADSGALEDIASFMELARGFPRLDWPAVHAFAGKLAGRGREAAQAATLDFIVQFLGTLVRRRARGETETDFGWKPADSLSRHLLGEYGLDRLLALWEKVAALIQMADARSLDRKHVVLGLFFAMEETLRQPDTDIS